MSDRHGSIGLAGIAFIPIACCLGLPLLAAAGVGAVTLLGGLAAGGVALVATAVLLARRRSAPMMRKTSQEALVEHGRERPLVEILYFDGCPNHEPARALVERVSAELGLEPELRLVSVSDEQAAQRLRFLGSPTVRVGGRDVDPHAEDRDEYVLSCRVYRTEGGFAGQPDERWVRDALRREAAGVS
jgi:hypothetical protein